MALAILATAMPTWALVPPKNADQPIPAVGLDRVRDDRAGAYTAANPLAGVVPSNINARKTAGTLNLSVLSGSFDYVVLPGKFLDSGADPWAPSELADELFLPGYSGLGRPGSLRDYFNEVSYGNYLIDGSVEPWVTTAQNEAFYLGAAGCNGLCASTTESAGGFIDEVIALNDSTVDFAQYDNDGPDGLPNSGDDDGVVDLLVVVQASSGGECGSSKLWSHFGRYSDWFGGTYTTNDAAAGGGSIVIEDYALVPALDCDNSSLVTIGPFAHVFGLHLGLPALWDRDSSSRGAGAFDVMARGMWGGDGNSPERPTHPSAYTKALAGWIVPQRVTGTELGASIPAVETNATAREFNRPDICSHEEYLLLENRQKTGFDSLLPGDGLLIWHADDSTATADEEARPRLHLVPGDARYGLNNGRNDGDFGDPWPGSAGRVSFRDDTDPSSRRWDDRPSGVSVNSISQSGDPMTADLNQDTGLLLDLRQVSFDDGLPGLGDGDGAIDPYETVRLTLAISNEGQLDATGISGTLSLNPPVAGVTITDNSHNWPDLTPCGASSDGIFEISLDETVACETALDFQLDLTTDQGTTTQTFQLRVGMFFTGPPAQLTTAAEDTGTVRIASRGGEAAAVYNEPSAGRQVIRMTRLDAQSSLLGTTDISAATVGNAVDPDVAWNGTEYGVTWEDDRDGTAEIYFARVDSAGVRIGSEVRVTTQAGQSSHPRIAWSSADSRWMIVWDDDRNGDTDVYFAALDSAGAKVVGDVLIASGVGQQSYPDLSWNGQRLGIVWQDDSTGEWTIRFVATDASGTAQSPVKRLEEGLGDTIRPAVAWNASGGTFGVVFIDYADGKTRPFIRATRMTQDGGLPVSVKPISEVMFRTDSVDIDSDGTNHFVIWTDHRDGRRSVRVSRTDDRFNIQLDSLHVADDTAHGQQVGIDFDSGQLYGVWLAEDATSHRIDAFARPFNTSFECGRDDDGDGVTQPGDNCPSTPNPDQADADSDNWGDACDCDDIDPNVNPGQPETICDNIDNDCDASSADAPDNDNDGVDQCDVGAANNPDGVGVDCDDTDPLNYPGNTEVCDGQDNDCDGSIDEDFPVLTWYRDADNDLYGDPNVTLDTCDGNNQGYVSDNTDCDDTRSDVNPGQLEACSDDVDNNCDGTINEVVGTRYLDPTGDDTANTCNDQLSPCLSFNHAIRMACDGETILVAEGDYTEDVVIDHPVVIDNAGSASLTNLHGTGATDVVKILSSSVTWDGVNTDGAPNDACIHVGDATNTGLRSLNIRNTSTYGCAVGIHMESTGVTGGWNRILSMDIHSNLANGNPNSGTGILLTGGNGKLEVKVGFIRNNEGPGMRVESPPTGSTNQTIVIVGNRIQNNGTSASADGVAGIEIHDSSDVRIEGNRIYDNISTGTGDDGRGVILDNVNGGNFFCNRVENNDTGLILSGGTTGFGLLHNKWVGQAGSALAIQAASGSATTLNENNFSGNATAVDNSGDGTLDARHNWWGAADGPSGGGSGSGDPVSGPLDTSNFIARDIAPVLVKRPVDFGWSESVSACREKIQNGINNAVAGDLLLVGAGEYKEHITMSKVLDIEGLSGGAGCSPTEISGIQSSGSHLPAFRISDVAGVSLKQLTIRSTGEGTVCGQNSGEEIGLDLQNVDNSTFSDICFKQNGVTEMRVYGDSDGNSFSNLTIDGMIRDPEGTDICGHRSREGILIDGGPACESGPGASADNNTFDNIEVNYCARSFSVRLASGTDIGNSTISASPAAAWDGGTLAFGVFVQMADNTRIHDSVIGSGEETDAIRVAGKEAGSCVTERSDTVGTRIENNDITDSTGAGIRIFKQSGDLGSPVDTYLTCNDLKLNGTGVLVNYVGTAPENRMYQNNITSNTEGVRNTAARAFNAQDNWWGSASGPSGSGPGTGDSVFGSVSFNPWLNNSVRIDDDVDNYAECDGDCDDSDSSINPDAAEICDGIDNDCDGTVDDGLPTNTYYRDFDGDTYGDPNNTVEDCASTPPTGYVTDNSDCDDTNDQIHPNATEIACDNVDQACDGSANEAPDDDNDGYDQCDPSDPYDGDGLPVDCDDTNGQIHPNATEIACDNVDQACDGSANEAPDDDNDGYDQCDPSDPYDGDGLP
ncbi:MAG TPA: M6 family metalloprotease domain-containing protein, partial [Acidobacteria bacterium]|nr:M6 family metalloprotease domain-containing protein [Acidobacteriota bacterium]